MPENQKKIPCARLPKHNPDSKPNSDTTPTSDGQIQRPEMTGNDREIEISEPNSDTTPASDGQIQRPEMTGNGREIEISELTFRQQAALPRIAPAKSLAQAARDTGVAERILAGTPPPGHESSRPTVHRANPYGSLRSVIPAKAGIQG